MSKQGLAAAGAEENGTKSGLVKRPKKHQKKRQSAEFHAVESTKKTVNFLDDSDRKLTDTSSISKTSVKEVARQLLKSRMELPIWDAKNALLKKFRDNRVLILVGETGSGKSTQIPQFINECDFSREGCVAITQPRRVAAVNLARRVAQEQGSKLGDTVGYSIRFDDCSSRSTRIKYMTDGMLLRELINDPLLSNYHTVILDEAHERTLLTDMLLGFVKKIIKKRPALRVIVMSATLDAERFSDFFDGAEICFISGRQYPVQVHYTYAPEVDYVDAALRSVFQLHTQLPAGDILVFLTGQDEIEALESVIKDYSKQLPPNVPQLHVCPLFASLPQEQQMQVFQPAPPNHRKVVLATNIAETSITISGIRYVIDTGLAKVKQYNARLGLESLSVAPISQSAARQRAGRAGREAPGQCFCLYTEQDFEKMSKETIPEIKRIDLAQAVLTLKARGQDDVIHFDYMDPPSRESLARALEHLYSIGALGDNGKITDIGYQMSLIPLVPSLARALLSAVENDCVAEVIDIVSCLSTDSLFVSPQDKREEANEAWSKFRHKLGDHLTSLNTVRQYLSVNVSARKSWCQKNFINKRALKTVLDIRKQLQEHANRAGWNCTANDNYNAESVLCSFLHGYITNTALLHPDGSYKTVIGNQNVSIHPSSTLFGKKVESIMYHESVFTTKPYARGVTAIHASWLTEVAPHYLGRQSA
ncbi:ATP-dependent RNA helicase Prh1 [Schizosaccharomyces japonicus yFS275]|uniref:RNA helicase n=1 Tax=Schizosaccharomyces japonicus (strain yFS275 / FY16936) TaxID=402676 RepID=B6K5C7_SCHJY|nr:ATP-dependent RNA helicase Prh1 [Schizosaccharomyces japonicus yFS275]EEB08731.1 ATP-dependent RNA helicase Prh1 [Schizosaccharomyces japonicus yFS275]